MRRGSEEGNLKPAKTFHLRNAVCNRKVNGAYGRMDNHSEGCSPGKAATPGLYRAGRRPERRNHHRAASGHSAAPRRVRCYAPLAPRPGRPGPALGVGPCACRLTATGGQERLKHVIDRSSSDRSSNLQRLPPRVSVLPSPSVCHENHGMLPSQRALFDIPRHVCFLNAASWSPLPIATQEAGRAGVARKGRPWLIDARFPAEQHERARRAAARLINADADDVALISSVSYGVAAAAKLLPVPAGSRVLVLANDHSPAGLGWMTRAGA